MDSSQWPQGIGVARGVVSDSNSRPSPGLIEKKPRPSKEHAFNCPRCSSTNTKFCYYNNYSLSQPRYFCKNCRRYWTEGGSLRNVPVGGGSRKNKRSSSSSSVSSSHSASSRKMVTRHLGQPNFLTTNPKIHQGQDLNLAYNPSHYNGISEFMALPLRLTVKNLNNNNSPAAASNHSAMELMKNGTMPIPVSYASNPMYSSGFPVHEWKSSSGFSLDGLNQNLYGSMNIPGVDGRHPNQSRMLIPFEEVKSASANGFGEDNRGQNEANGFWNRMLAGGSW